MTRVGAALLVVTMLVACTNSDSADQCQALYGPEPWLILNTTDWDGCVSVGVHQDLQIWNKGTEAMTVEWPGEVLDLSSDDHYSTGPIGDIFEPGVYAVEANPYSAPDLHVVPTADSRSAGTALGAEGFGPIALGMTLAQASEVFDQPVEVDPDLGSGPNCWIAVVTGDPYSPLLTVEGQGDQESVVTHISTFYPPGRAGTLSLPSASVPYGCG